MKFLDARTVGRTALALLVFALLVELALTSTPLVIKVRYAPSGPSRSPTSTRSCFWFRDICIENFLDCTQGGTVVNADRMFQADVAVQNGTITAVGTDLEVRILCL